MDVRYSNGAVARGVVAQVWDDLNAERPGRFRAYWCADGDATTGSPVFGLASGAGSHRTVRSAAAEVRRLFPGERVFRNGREVR